MQTKFLSYIRKEERNKLISNVIGVIDYCVDKDIPILEFECFELENHGSTNKDIKKSIELAPRKKLITKYSMSAFSARDTNNYLKEVEADCTILSGLNKSACVFWSAKGSVRNYETLLAEDIMADGNRAINWAKEYDIDPMNWYKKRCKLFGTYEELIDYLELSALH